MRKNIAKRVLLVAVSIMITLSYSLSAFACTNQSSSKNHKDCGQKQVSNHSDLKGKKDNSYNKNDNKEEIYK